jgi:hypothetical protein
MRSTAGVFLLRRKEVYNFKKKKSQYIRNLRMTGVYETILAVENSKYYAC